MIGDTSSPIEAVLRNKRRTQEFWIKVLNGGQYDLVEKLLAPDYSYNGKPSVPASTAEWIKSLREAAPDTLFRVESLTGAHNTVAIRWTMTATLEGKQTMLTGENVLTFNEEGLCVSNWQSMGSAAFAVVIPGS